MDCLRNTLKLKGLIGCTSSIVTAIKKLNERIVTRYGVKITNDCIVINNISLFLTDYVRSIIKKDPSKQKWMLKWSCDQRSLFNEKGNVGLSVQLLEEKENQDPHKVIYVCIGNGKENITFFENNLLEHRDFCNQLNDEFDVDGTKIEMFFLADLKHLWENSYYFNELEPPPKIILFPQLLPRTDPILPTGDQMLLDHSANDFGDELGDVISNNNNIQINIQNKNNLNKNNTIIYHNPDAVY